jgi:hypothetical protein
MKSGELRCSQNFVLLPGVKGNIGKLIFEPRIFELTLWIFTILRSMYFGFDPAQMWLKEAHEDYK